VTVLDILRRGPGGYAVRRQLLQLGSGLWLALDQIRDETPRRSVTLWTTYPELGVAEGPFENAFRLKSRSGSQTMTALFLASAGTEMKTYRGSREPFAGWVVVDGTPTPATAFRIDQPSQNSWALALWVPERRNGAVAVSTPPEMLDWTSAERWKLSVPLRRGRIVLQRIDADVSVREDAGERGESRVTLVRAPDVSAQRAAIRSAFEAIEVQFKTSYRDLYRYRLKITYLLLAILAAQETLCFLLRNVIGKSQLALRAALGLGWLTMGAWIVFGYLG
jgi:hypothetical protein